MSFFAKIIVKNQSAAKVMQIDRFLIIILEKNNALTLPIIFKIFSFRLIIFGFWPSLIDKNQIILNY